MVFSRKGQAGGTGLAQPCASSTSSMGQRCMLRRLSVAMGCLSQSEREQLQGCPRRDRTTLQIQLRIRSARDRAEETSPRRLSHRPSRPKGRRRLHVRDCSARQHTLRVHAVQSMSNVDEVEEGDLFWLTGPRRVTGCCRSPLHSLRHSGGKCSIHAHVNSLAYALIMEIASASSRNESLRTPMQPRQRPNQLIAIHITLSNVTRTTNYSSGNLA